VKSIKIYKKNHLLFYLIITPQTYYLFISACILNTVKMIFS